jgi:hypothetical protein
MSILLTLDLTGRSAEHRLGLPVEIQGITTPTYGESISSPYGLFHNNVTVIDVVTKNPLTLDTDYVLGLFDNKAFNETGVMLYTNIVLVNHALAGGITLYANYAGGKYATPTNQDIPDLIELVLLTKRAISWDALLNAPLTKPPVDHPVVAAELTTGLQLVTARLWQAFNNKRAIGPELIQIVASGTLKKMQAKEDFSLHTTDKTIEGAISELHTRSSLVFGGGGVILSYLGTITTNAFTDLDISTPGYWLIGDPIGGTTLNVLGMWDDGSSTKSIVSGSVLAVISGTIRDITKHAGAYGLANIKAGSIYNKTYTFKDGVGLLYTLTQPNLGSGAVTLNADTDASTLSKATIMTALTTLALKGRWKDTTWVSTRLVPSGAVIKFNPASGLELTAEYPSRLDLGDLPLTSSKLNTEAKSVLGAIAEIKANGPTLDYATGDLITVVKGTPMIGGVVKAGSAPVSRITYPRLFSMWGTGFGMGDGTTTFGVPAEPALAGALYTAIDGAVIPVTSHSFFSQDFVWLVDVDATNLVTVKYNVSDRSVASTLTTTPHTHGATISPIGVIGNLLYFVGNSGGWALWSMTLDANVIAKVVDLTGSYKGIPDGPGDALYLANSTSVIKVNLITSTLSDVVTAVDFDTVNDVDYSYLNKSIYLATSGGLVRVSLDGAVVITINSNPAVRVNVSDDQDTVLAQAEEFGTCYRHQLTNDTEADSSTANGWLVYHTHHRTYRNISSVATKQLTAMQESPIYEYYFKE